MGLRVSALFNGVPLKECTQCIAMFTLGIAKKNMFLSWYFAILVYHTGDHKYMCENLKNYEFESIYLILAVGNSWGWIEKLSSTKDFASVRSHTNHWLWNENQFPSFSILVQEQCLFEFMLMVDVGRWCKWWAVACSITVVLFISDINRWRNFWNLPFLLIFSINGLKTDYKPYFAW